MNKSQLLKSLKEQGFSKQVLDAFLKVKRENFVPRNLGHLAYEDRPLPLDSNQETTISQPSTIAIMLNMLDLKQEQKVLELGSGCGYVLALIAEIVGEKGEVYGVEIMPKLAEKSRENLKNYENVHVYNKNGRQGLEQVAPFDRILISAACEEIPKKVLEQLKYSGIVVAPIGSEYEQTLRSIQRNKNKFNPIKDIEGFMFVKFV